MRVCVPMYACQHCLDGMRKTEATSSRKKGGNEPGLKGRDWKVVAQDTNPLLSWKTPPDQVVVC